MLRDFEQRFAQVLGSQLTAPFAGRVRTAPVDTGDNGIQIVVSVGKMKIQSPDFGSFRSENAPGITDPLRIVRLRGEVGIVVFPAQGQGRQQQLQGIDSLLYLLDTPDFRNANALASQQDQGFLLDYLKIVEADLSIRDTNTDPTPDITLEVEGWFWPIGQTGVSGDVITQAHVRQFVLPVSMVTDNGPIVAGGNAVQLNFNVGTSGSMVLQGSSSSTLPFGNIAVRLLSADGSPGQGSLSGGLAGPDNSQLTLLANGSASLSYTPPGSATNERVVVTTVIMDGNTPVRLGIELASFNIQVGN
ncbi:MAG: hypothetical protein G3M70_05205 [Candidatus Nitronauta litoralis]|uniref:Uncharacterized protein n=1 Tax=Candidatus Nitronauta litoralis TaxID=2705533 RepID=A0A7T0FZL7_9BACT|nr:MAG: hypothetical protein G3M70_05205 [Candidatus Nitronauta litoralis]